MQRQIQFNSNNNKKLNMYSHDLNTICERLNLIRINVKINKTIDLITGDEITESDDKKYKTQFDTLYSGSLNLQGSPTIFHFNHFVNTLLAIENSEVSNFDTKSTENILRRMFDKKEQFPPFLSECGTYEQFVKRLKEPFAMLKINDKYLMINILRVIESNGYIKGGLIHSLGKHYSKIYKGNKSLSLFQKHINIPRIIEDIVLCFSTRAIRQPDNKIKYTYSYYTRRRFEKKQGRIILKPIEEERTLITKQDEGEFFEHVNNILPYIKKRIL